VNFVERRARVIERIGPCALLLLPSTPTYLRNRDVEHEYRPDSDLMYLSGWHEPHSVLALGPGDEGIAHFTLFVRPKDPAREVWEGGRHGVEGAVDLFGATHAADIASLDDALPELLLGRQRLFYALGHDRTMDERILSALAAARRRARKGRIAPTEIIDPSTVLHELRWIKDLREQHAMQRAADITAEAFGRAMREVRPGAFEYEIEADLRQTFRRRGSLRPAYQPIVASGENACTLHHIRNDRRMRDGELVLIDAGAEFDGYASDVTRTFPVGGRFSPAQRRVYDAVLRAQREALAAVAPGATLLSVHQAAVRSLTGSMIELGLLEGSLDERIEAEDYKRYFMHGTSHWLGMDVHDVGQDYLDGHPRPLVPGVALTVEPGLYIRPDDVLAPAEFRGIGVRIEDDVLVTSEGARVLTEAIPKEPDAIERLMSREESPRHPGPPLGRS
jgi:Xaa-Pro aminopeptidase